MAKTLFFLKQKASVLLLLPWKKIQRMIKDSQVVQGVQAGEGLFGDGSDLVPLKVSKGEREEKKKGKPIKLGNQLFEICCATFRGWKHSGTLFQNLQLLQFVQRRERPVHVFNGPGDFILLEIPSRGNKDKPRCYNKTEKKNTHTPHPSNDCELRW